MTVNGVSLDRMVQLALHEVTHAYKLRIVLLKSCMKGFLVSSRYM